VANIGSKMRRTGYNVLDTEDGGDDVVDSPSDRLIEDETIFSDAKSHKRTLCLVFTLFFGGFITLLTSSLILLGHLDNEVYADRLIPLIILGFLMFVPGAYYMRIVYKTWLNRPGYSFDQIPSCY